MSRKVMLGAAAVALLLSGCTVLRGDKPGTPRASPTEVAVQVVNGVPQPAEKLLVYTGRGRVTLTWTLDPKAGFRFDRENGIRIVGEVLDEELKDANGRTVGVRIDDKQAEIGGCRIADSEGYRFSCVNERSRSGVFKYAISVRDAKGQLLVNDPPIVNWVGEN